MSVVIPVYNVEEWLDRCLHSVVSQTHQDLDIILINDGSTDRSGAICDEWADRDPRIRVVHQSNGGLSGARNAGLRLIRGDYITFVDSDDWLHPEMISTLLGWMEPRTRAIAVAGFLRASERTDPPPLLRARPECLTRQEALARLLGPQHTSMAVVWGKLFSRDVVARLSFPEGRLHEDEFVAHRLILASETVLISGEPMYFYFQRETSIMGSPYTVKRGMDTIAAERMRADEIARLGYTDLELIAWQQLVRRILKVLCWALREEDRETQRILSQQLSDLRSEPVWFRLSTATRFLVHIAGGYPQAACLLLRLRSTIFGAPAAA